MLTAPASTTKEFLREFEARKAELSAFLKASGCTTAAKRRKAMLVAATYPRPVVEKAVN